ncbi:hypothetical protein CBC_A1683 [Clostridium botulinum C str. Eklund]|nr:hypothetical protein CBC_A1683 [Clostridium botulinum C str. Eklund]
MDNKQSKEKIISYISYFICILFLGTGFYKMFCYNNNTSSYSRDSVNAYVGGDAYNYIINSNYANCYFILALIFVIIGSVALIIDKIDNKN